VHFNGDEMVRSGFYMGIPLYTRTTIEPYSVVFVPLSGGLMQPYERRREGELAGTAGSSAPSFPIASPSEPMREGVAVPLTAQAPGPPMLGTAAGLAYPSEMPVAPEVESAPVGTTSGIAALAASRPLRRRADSANAIFVEFQDTRWFSSGPPEPLDASRLTRIGSVGGFPVYTAGSRGPTIYIPITAGADIVAPYTRRSK
jgi:hypothetical protein